MAVVAVLILVALFTLMAIGLVISLLAFAALLAGLCRLVRGVFRKVLA